MSENIPPVNPIRSQRLIQKQDRVLRPSNVKGDVAERKGVPLRPVSHNVPKAKDSTHFTQSIQEKTRNKQTVQEKAQGKQNIQKTETTSNAELGSKRKRDVSQKNDQNKDDEKDDIKTLNGYEKLSKIGEGTYGVVFKALHKSTNKIVALKKVRVAYSEGIPVTAMREIAILKEVRHNNVIGYDDELHSALANYWHMLHSL